MNNTQNPPQTRPVPRARPRAVRSLAEPEPQTGLWGYRMAQVLAATLLVLVVPVTLAVGLGWVDPEQMQRAVPGLRRLATFVWTLSLFSLILSLFGVCDFGPKRRTLWGLAINAILALGPFAVALLLR